MQEISKKQKFIQDGLFYAELNDFLARELAHFGYTGCEIKKTPRRTEITIRALKSVQIIGRDGQHIRELISLVQKRFGYPKHSICMYAELVKNRGLSALGHAQMLKFKLFYGLSVRKAVYSVLKSIMKKQAKGCEITISGKIRCVFILLL